MPFASLQAILKYSQVAGQLIDLGSEVPADGCSRGRTSGKIGQEKCWIQDFNTWKLARVRKTKQYITKQT